MLKTERTGVLQFLKTVKEKNNKMDSIQYLIYKTSRKLSS